MCVCAINTWINTEFSRWSFLQVPKSCCQGATKDMVVQKVTPWTSAPWSVDIWRIEPDRTDGTWQVCHHRIKQLEAKIMVYPIFKTISFVSRSRPSRTRHQPAHPISSHSPRMEVHWWKPDKGRRWCRFRVAWPLPRPQKKTSMSNLWSPAFHFSCLGWYIPIDRKNISTLLGIQGLPSIWNHNSPFLDCESVNPKKNICWKWGTPSFAVDPRGEIEEHCANQRRLRRGDWRQGVARKGRFQKQQSNPNGLSGMGPFSSCFILEIS